MREYGLNRALALLLAILWLASPLLTIGALAAEGAAPVNLAREATFTADSSQEDVSWSIKFINDGHLVGDASGLGLGYCSATAGEANVTATFPAAATFNEVKIWPASSSYDNCYQGHMARDFDLLISDDGKTWTTVHETRGYAHPEDNTASDPYVVRLEEAVTAKYLRWHIIAAAKSETIIQEFEVYMNTDAPVVVETTMEMDRPALELLPGMTDRLSTVVRNETDGEPVGKITWRSENPGVATVDQNGNIKAVAVGETAITATSASGLTATCRIFVVKERKNVFDENIVVSIFWPPVDPGYVKEEQYKLMADAGITYVMGAGENVGEKEDQLNMLSWCYKYGMQMMLGDDRMGPSMANKTYADLEKLLAEYKNVPGVAGYWLVDEPGSAVGYQEVYKNLKTLTPDKHVYLNFLPDFDLRVIDDWLRYCAGIGHPAFYYQYDSYNTFANHTDYERQIRSLRDGWLLCRDTDTELAAFILSTGHEPYRQPDEDDVRWQMNVSLAFGAKNMQYFTWFAPTGWGDGIGIVGGDGKPTPLYEGVSRVNHETLKIGTVLKDLSVADVRVSGNHYTDLPFTDEFFAQPDKKADFVVSLMYNEDTGRNYMMVVSNDCDRSVDIALTLDEAVSSLKLVENGTKQSYTFQDGKLTMKAEPGEAFLFELPAACNFVPAPEEPKAGENLAAAGYVMASESVPDGKYFIQNLTDGVRFSNAESGGWRANEHLPVDVTLDLKAARTFNRIDLYPAGVGDVYGANMPADFAVQVSEDGQTWVDVVTVKDYKQTDKLAPSYTFDAVEARYVRVHITKMAGDKVEICEIEVFSDDGSLPGVEEYVPGKSLVNVNIAPDATVTATSSQESYGWALAHLTDGHKMYSDQNGSNGFCSATKGACDVVFDFGYAVDLNLVKIWPALNPHDHSYDTAYPSACSIDVSDDGKTWKTVASVSNYEHTSGANPLELAFATETARYLRWHIDGAIFNEVLVSELEIFCMEKASPDTPEETDPSEQTKPTEPEDTANPEDTGKPEDTTVADRDETAVATGEVTNGATEPAVSATMSEEETDGMDKGCASAMAGMATLLVLTAGGAIILRRKEFAYVSYCAPF